MREIILYIHGITPAPYPGLHKKKYDGFHQLLSKNLKNLDCPMEFHRVDVEWGFEEQASPTEDRILSEMERWLFRKMDERPVRRKKLSWRGWLDVQRSIRNYLVLGFNDVVYYISEDGKKQVRKNVLSTLLNNLPFLKDDGDQYMLTIIAHSAGTLIAHDVLFILFGPGRQHFLTEPQDLEVLGQLQDLAGSGRLAVRRLITMGSPLAPLIVRSEELMRIIRGDGRFDGKIDEETIGIRRGAVTSRWLNFWDERDAFSYPLSFMYISRDQAVEDIPVTLGKGFPDVHRQYWYSDEIPRRVAESLAESLAEKVT
ncbi:MAG: hypothetical protein OEW12_03115 [Deltaproteobacteria bacterium]|nr:hypothetical protein [Deltaproteobacteria bacterium]